jgi:hypothetical protein
MFKNAAPSAHSSKRSRKAAVVVAEPELMRRARRAVPESTPALAGRVRHHGVRASVQPGVACRWPGINFWQTVVAPTFLDVERGDHRLSIRTC